MKRTAEVTIPEEQLDHMATAFIKAASSFSCQISITRDGHSVNGKSLLGFLSLMREGGAVEITAEGGDAIKELMGSSVPQMLGSPGVAEQLAHESMEKFEERLDHEVLRILNGWGR